LLNDIQEIIDQVDGISQQANQVNLSRIWKAYKGKVKQLRKECKCYTKDLVTVLMAGTSAITTHTFTGEPNKLPLVYDSGCRIDSCGRGCSCHCHYETFFSSPRQLQSLLGYLMVKRKRLPCIPCNSSGCFLRGAASTTIIYVFPRFFLQRALTLVISRSENSGPGFSLNFQRILPKDSEVFQYCYEGNLGMLRELFAQGRASHFDIDSDCDTMLHVS